MNQESINENNLKVVAMASFQNGDFRPAKDYFDAYLNLLNQKQEPNISIQKGELTICSEISPNYTATCVELYS
jgi:hypothetical protein